MNDDLVTLAIHTYEQAEILRTKLESENIEVYIQNVNQIQPVVSVGVRVRIKKSDLPKALLISESMDLNEGRRSDEAKKLTGILVPVDFSEYSIQACEAAFRWAEKQRVSILILHAYCAPSDPFVYKKDEEALNRLKTKATEEMANLCAQLKKKVATKELPLVNFSTRIQEGVPEDEIEKITRRNNFSLVIMGTRGKDRKEQDLIGSVTAEIIEQSNTPVLAIPENNILSFQSIKNVAYATNFNSNDLVAFERMVSVLRPFNYKVYLIHIESTQNAWNEIRLAAINEYFKKQYPNVEVEYHLLKLNNDLLNSIDEFIAEKNIDIISLNTHKRNLFARLFSPSFARKMIFHAKTPMLIFHS